MEALIVGFVALVLVAVCYVVADWLAARRARKIDERLGMPPRRPVRIYVDFRQIAGETCATCAEDIVRHFDGSFCAPCGAGVHYACATRHAIACAQERDPALSTPYRANGVGVSPRS